MRVTLCATVVALLLFAPFVAAADAPWNGAAMSADPAAMLAAAEAVPAGDADAVVLLEDLHYTIDDEGRATSTSRLIFRLTAESAIDDWSTVEAEWAPWYEDRPVIAARVIGRDRVVHMLDPKAVVESAAREDSPEIFSDNRVLRAPLPGIAAGSVVEQVVTRHHRNPLNTGAAGSLMLGRYAPVEKARLVIDAPASLRIAFVNKSAPRIEPVKTEADGRQHIVIETGRLEALEDLEWNLPYDESNVPYVAFSTGSSWQDAARRYSEIVEKQIGDAAAVQPFLRSAIGSSTDRREIVTKALAAIQKQIRYAGVEVGEGSIVPRPPKDVLALKYGDCKDKATLLVAMLRAAGVPAHVALLNSGTGFDIDEDLPSLGRFNHVIVRVGEDDAFWVDPTDEFSPAGVLPIGDQDRLALVASATTTGLTRTPAAESAANFTRETRTFVLAEEGKSAVTEVTVDSGAPAASNRRYAASHDKKEYRESMESYVKGAYGAESLKSATHTDPRDLGTPFEITLEAEKAERGQTGDIDAVAALLPSQLVGGLPWLLREDPAEDEKNDRKPRVHDFVITMPYVKEYVYRIVPPPGFAPRTLPPAETRALGTASLTSSYSVAADGAVVATLRFDSGKRRLTPAELTGTRKALSGISDSSAIIVGFDSIGWSKLQAGDVGGAIAEFRRLVAVHPKEARHHTQVGRAYFLGGMGESAREELRRAVALEPGYAPAHRYLGIVLQHDLLGREFRKGFDLAGAIAAYRKARELDPKNVEIRAELAKLLSRGEDGELYGRGARLAESIKEYEAIASDLDDHRYDGELLAAMAFAGRFEDMKTRARRVEDTTQRLTALVVAAAATEGVEAALREAGNADQNARRGILGGAFPTLLQLRLYSQAATVLDQATQGAPNAAQVRPMIDVLRRARRYEDMQFGDDPKAMVMRVMMTTGNADDPEAIARGYSAPWLLAFEDDLKAKRVREESAPAADAMIVSARIKAQAQGLPMQVAVEIGAGAMDLSQEGSDATGYRVRMRTNGAIPGAEAVSQTFYVVRDNGRYLLGAGGAASVGIAVLHFLEQNELEAARTWLNWAREPLSAGGGDDPLSGSSFAALWPKGKSTATVEEMRAAAATLLIGDRDYALGAIPRLVAARETVPEALRTRVDVALATAYSQAEDFANMLVVAKRVLDAYPESALAFTGYATALAENGRVDEARKLTQDRLEKMQDDPDALRMLAELASRVGDFTTADSIMKKIVDRSDALSNDFNNLAWNALFVGKEIDRAIEEANRAVSMSESWPAMHTLAALYAEAGKSLEARTKLFEAMDLAGREEPSSVDWYVLGRIAENYGAVDAALAAYRRVTKPSRNRSGSTYELAQRRVQSLGRK